VRADRLVSLLLLMQSRGRVTAAQAAAVLEVSVPTARRDLEALALAGVPVYAQPGRGGGWSLVGGARTDLTGLSADEVSALFLVAGPGATASPAVRSALRKLVRAVPATFRSDAEAAAGAVLVDPRRWGAGPVARPPHLDDLERAVGRSRKACLVVRASLVRDEHNPLQAVHVAQEVELPLGGVAFPDAARVAGGAARHREPVVARQVQTLVKELVDLLADAAVAAIDAGRVNARAVEGERADEAMRFFSVRFAIPSHGKVLTLEAHDGRIY